MAETLIHPQAKRPTSARPVPLPKQQPGLAEGNRPKRILRPVIPDRPGRPADQNSPTRTAPDDGGTGDQRITFATYTPSPVPGNGGPAPPDPSGADSAEGVILYTGNSYLMASVDSGATFTEHDTTKFLPASQGRPVDQVMIYVRHRRLFAWMMQHGQATPASDGNFRLAVASAADLARDIERVWTVYDFTSSDLGQPGSPTDRQDLAFSETRLYMTTNVNKGRVVMTLDLEDLVQRRTVHWSHTNPLDGMFQFSDLSQQNDQNVNSVAIATASSLRVMRLDDGAGTYDFHDVTVGKFPTATDLSSLDPTKNDWLTNGVANVSAAVVHGADLWVAWDAAASPAGDTPFYPNAHVRIARIDRATWAVAEERQVWNPDYAFAYGCLAVGPNGDVGYGVGVGGTHDFPNSCFGILGDFIVYFRDKSTATATRVSTLRWGDYITVRPSVTDERRFAAFGYFTTKSVGGGDQHPFYLSYGRP